MGRGKKRRCENAAEMTGPSHFHSITAGSARDGTRKKSVETNLVRCDDAAGTSARATSIAPDTCAKSGLTRNLRGRQQ
jgi:hypothetical protein